MNSKAAQERQQRILLDLVRQPGNDVCADCKGRAPRWASWNLGIFICVQCAGVHRKMGVHISKVKSLTLDTWTREQVERMKQIGNVKSNKIFNPDEMRNRPPTNMEESERDSELEKYIRRKYEFRRFMEGRPPPVPTKDATFLTSPPSSTGRSGPPKSPIEASSSSRTQGNLADGNSIARSRTAPIPSTWKEAQQRAKANAPPLPSPSASAFRAASGSHSIGVSSASNSATQVQSSLQLPGTSVPLRTSSALNTNNGSGSVAAASKPTTATAQSSVFDDLISLSDPAQTPPANQPPLQMNPWASLQAQQQAVLSAPAIQDSSANFWSGHLGASAAGASANLFGLSPSNNASGFAQMRNMPQHANTAPALPLASQQLQMSPQATGMLSPSSNGMMNPPYQQQRSASLGTMAFSPPSLSTPSHAPSNPFSTMQSTFASALPQTTVFASGAYQQQPQQLGQVAFQGGASANLINPNANFISPPQPPIQGQPVVGAMGQFHASMMPNGYGQSTQFGSAFMQQ